jgi:carbonic anhydrase
LSTLRTLSKAKRFRYSVTHFFKLFSLVHDDQRHLFVLDDRVGQRLFQEKYMNSQITSSEALKLLIEGNERFASGLRSVETTMSVAKMKELAEKGQAPFAIVLTCSDSRVPCEILFDRGLGDIFVVRVAGNVTSPMVIASVEYAAQVLGSPLCVVMGHSGCGAVATAVSAENDAKVGKALTADLNVLISAISPAVQEAQRLIGPHASRETCVQEATMANIHRSVSLIGKSPVVTDLTKKGKLAVIGAIYDIHTGVVKFDDQPLFSEVLVNAPNSVHRPVKYDHVGLSAAASEN